VSVSDISRCTDPLVGAYWSIGILLCALPFIDGDTLKIRSAHIRLSGIDAPERDQSCLVRGQTYLCGRFATLALSGKIGGQTVTCKWRSRDQYERLLGTCYADGENLNKWMVAQGWALAYRQYSMAYVWLEWMASWDDLGIWQGEFLDPWNWRRGERL
jgi:endonuclease YncB( thermonuclease family)